MSDVECDSETNHLFDGPRYGTPRGARRLVNSLRKTISGFQDAHKKAASSVERSDQELANDIRTTLVTEIEELEREFPEPRQESGVIATLNGARDILSECPAFDIGEAPTNVSPAYNDGTADNSSQSQSRTIAESESIIDITVGQHTDEAAGQLAPNMNEPSPSGSGDQVSANSDIDKQINELREKLFEADQRVMDLETELQGESQRHTQECKDIAKRYEDELDKLQQTCTAREQTLQKRIDELAACLSQEKERQREAQSGPKYVWVEGYGLVPQVPTVSCPRAPVSAPATLSHTSAPPTATTPTTTASSVTTPLISLTPPANQVSATTTNQTPPADNLSRVSYNTAGAASDATTLSLLEIQTQAHAYQMLVQKRPRHKYSGDNKHIDLESFLHQCKALMNVAGATASMKLAELPYWFSGNAGLIIDRFIGEADADRALTEAFEALRTEFGRRRVTARKMLAEHLQGEKLLERNHAQIKTFILNLEKVFKVAKETGRDGSFNMPEVINQVIRSKLPHLAEEWAKKVSASDLNKGTGLPALTFTNFVEFAKEQNSISQTTGEILKNPDSAKPTTTIRVASTRTEPTNTGPSQVRPPSRGTCIICPGSAHHTNECRKLAAYSGEEKAKVVRDKRLCTSCLGQTSATHKAMNCATKVGCAICGERHHTLLHGIPYRDLRLNSNPSQSPL